MVLKTGSYWQVQPRARHGIGPIKSRKIGSSIVKIVDSTGKNLRIELIFNFFTVLVFKTIVTIQVKLKE